MKSETSKLIRTTMASYFQGGDYVELLSAQGKTPASTWKLQGKITRSFEKAIKGNVFHMVGSSETRMQLPKNPTSSSCSLGLTQRFLILQLLVPLTRSFSLEVGFSDFQKVRRRLIFASAFRETTMTALHIQIPIDASVTRDRWMNLVFDLQSLSESCFTGCSYRSMESICISGSCRLKRVFTMKDPPNCSFVDERCTARISASVNPAARFTERQQDIPRHFVFSANPSCLPVPTEYFSMSSISELEATSLTTGSVQPVQSRSNNGAVTTVGTSNKAKQGNVRPTASVGARITSGRMNCTHFPGTKHSTRATTTSTVRSQTVERIGLGRNDAGGTIVAESTASKSNESLPSSLPSPEKNVEDINPRRICRQLNLGEDPLATDADRASPHELMTLDESDRLVTHDVADCCCKSADGFERKLQRQNIIAKIQLKLNQLTQESEGEVPYPLQNTLTSTETQNQPKLLVSGEFAALRSTKIQPEQLSLAVATTEPNHSKLEPWKDFDLLRSPEPMVLHRVCAVKKPEISFSSSIFSFDRDEDTDMKQISRDNDNGRIASNRRDLFDWGALLGDSVGLLSESIATPAMTQSRLEGVTKPPKALKDAVAQSIELTEGDEIAKDQVDFIDENTADFTYSKVEIKNASHAMQSIAPSNRCLVERIALDIPILPSQGLVGKVEQMDDTSKIQSPRSPGVESTFDFALSPIREYHQAKMSDDGDEIQCKSSPHPASECGISLDMTDCLRTLDRCHWSDSRETRRRCQERGSISDERNTSYDGGMQNSVSITPIDRVLGTKLEPRSFFTGATTSTCSARGEETALFGKSQKEANGNVKHQLNEVDVEANRPPNQFASRPPLSADGRLASLLESTDWSHLPLVSTLRSLSPKILTKCSEQSFKAAEGDRRKREPSSGTSIELIYDPILRCYYDPVSKTYYKLATQH